MTTDMDEAVEEVIGFYRNYHSYRYVDKKLVMRLQHPVTIEMLKRLNRDFSDLLDEGEFAASEALPEEQDEVHLKDMPRLICHKKRGIAGRFRDLINVVNEY